MWAYMAVLVGCSADTTNVIGNKNASLENLPVKVGRGAPVFNQHKFPDTLLDSNICKDGGGQAKILKHVPVSTGLRLSYGEEHHENTMPHSDNLKTACSTEQ